MVCTVDDQNDIFDLYDLYDLYDLSEVRNVSMDASLGICSLPVVENTSSKNRSILGCVFVLRVTWYLV